MKISIKEVSLILAGMAVVYLVPILSSEFSFPFYYLEPMRLFVVLAIVLSTKRSAYLTAIVLPAFSFLIANHPSLAKTCILCGDLLLNVFLFHYLTKFLSNRFLVMSISIVLSKIAYYLLKFILIEFSLISGNLISTPLYYQAVIVIVLSGYVYCADKIKMREN
jgi:hypothetical protein